MADLSSPDAIVEGEIIIVCGVGYHSGGRCCPHLGFRGSFTCINAVEPAFVPLYG
jgi:hypothetical protein